MRAWAKAHGLEKLYNQYLADCEAISQQCEEEGYPSHGANYEIRVEQLEKDYPELFDMEE